MIQKLWLGLIGLAFALACHVTVKVNELPTFAADPVPPAVLGALLEANDLTVVPQAGVPAPLLAGAVRFGLPGCAADGFVLPLADILLTDVQAIRFSEITGATYHSHAVRMGGADGVLEGRLARAMAAFKAAFGFNAPTRGHTVLAVFMPVGCTRAPPDLSAFWTPSARPDDTPAEGGSRWVP